MPYPSYHSLMEKLAAKVITRVVTDGLDLGDALKEAIRYADLNKQQVIHMCSILQDYGMVYNGDHRSYFSYTEDLGKGVPLNPNGYVVYANKNKKMEKVFNSIENLRKAGYDDAGIVEMNPDLKGILSSINEVERNYEDLVRDLKAAGADEGDIEDVADEGFQTPISDLMNERGISSPDDIGGEGFDGETKFVSEEEVAYASRWAMGLLKRGQGGDVEVEVEEATPDNVKKALEADNAPEGEVGDEEGLGDLGDEEFSVEEVGGDGGEETSVGGASVTLRKGPDYFTDKLGNAPKWNVDNILSIEVASNYYDNLKKELEEIVFNENLEISDEVMNQLNDARSSIDEASSKIKDAQKETEKIEDKKQDVEEEFEVGDEEGLGDLDSAGLEEEQPKEDFQVEGDVPTDEMLVEEEEIK